MGLVTVNDTFSMKIFLFIFALDLTQKVEVVYTVL